jgi:hypothetical protein
MQKLSEIDDFRLDDWTKTVPGRCFVDRDDAIVETCRGRSVLHVGACDAPFDIHKGQAGQLLHQKVQRVASRLVGVDVDRDAIAALKSIGIDNILEADICTDHILQGEVFDVVLCCDVIEHVTAAGPLLAGCRRYMGRDSVLVVTTINATAIKPALRGLRGKESVHDDHVAYYSYATLGKLLTIERLKPVRFGVFAYPTVNPLVGLISKRIMMAAPAAADGILFYACISGDEFTDALIETGSAPG